MQILQVPTVRLAALSACVLVTWLLPALVQAQTVRGIVVDRDGAPVSGVLATLVDSTDTGVARSLSNDRGEFTLRAVRAGTYVVRSLRIGYRQVTSPSMQLGLSEVVVTRLVLDDVKLQLETIRVAAKSVCEVRAESAAQTFALWEQARAALSAAELSATGDSLVATTVHYDRVLERSGPRIVGQIVTTSSGTAAHPWLTLPVDSLAKSGYVRVTDDTTTYLAPGLDMLASDTFLSSHCLRLVSAADSSRIGINFEPVRDRRGIADIRGTLWLDRSTAELRQVEFGYSNVSRDQAKYAGGDVRLVRMTNGAWAISRWYIRMPVFTLRRMPSGLFDPELILIETRISGGELSTITRSVANGIDTLWAHEPLVMRGTVSDSLSGQAVPGASVNLVGTNLVGTTNAAGEFTIPDVLPGQYDADVRSPMLSEIGAVSRSSVVFLESGDKVALRVVSRNQVLAALCPQTRFDRNGVGEGVVIGSLLTGQDDPRVANVRVVVEWRAITLRGGSTGASLERQSHHLESQTDSLGAFRICGVPVNTDLELRAIGDSVSSLPMPLRIPAELGIVRVNPVLSTASVRTAVFAGVVMVDSSNRTLPDAEIAFPDLGLATRSNARGEFRIADVPPGTHKIVARSLGYSPLEAEIAFAPNQIDERTLYLHAVTVLDSMVTTASARSLRSFDDNRRVGLGRFLTREDLARMENFSMAAVVGQFSGVDMKRGKSTQAWVASSRGPRSMSGADLTSPSSFDLGAKAACYAHVWVDGVQVYHGRDQEPLFNLASIVPAQIEAVEYYAGPSQTPGQYLGLKSTCGVLVIWMRR